MRMRTTKRSLIDTLTELVGIKSGLVITDHLLIRILENNFGEIDKVSPVLGGPSKWWKNNNEEEFFGIRGEEIEANFILLMAGIGAIPDNRTKGRMIVQFVRQNSSVFGINLSDTHAVYSQSMRISAALFDTTTAEVFIKETQNIPNLREIIQEIERRDIIDHSLPVTRSWDGLIPLKDLFESENIPQNTSIGHYFDQRFIDYLNTQPSDLRTMHWRQFEYFVGEYFHRNNYQVTITQARGDDGQDVIAQRHSGIAGPDLIVIQCKRYKESNTVKIDQVKAFWTTVSDAQATKGLIATTSKLESGARAFCEARKYQLSFAEHEQVLEWLQSLSTHQRT